MENASKAIYIAAFALLFIFAASVAIFLYTSLNAYLGEATLSTNITSRAEGATSEDVNIEPRKITAGEICVVIFNMDQMHVDEVTLPGGKTITKEDMEDYSSLSNDKKGDIYDLARNPNAEYTYSSSENKVTYSQK